MRRGVRGRLLRRPRAGMRQLRHAGGGRALRVQDARAELDRLCPAVRPRLPRPLHAHARVPRQLSTCQGEQARPVRRPVQAPCSEGMQRRPAVLGGGARGPPPVPEGVPAAADRVRDARRPAVTATGGPNLRLSRHVRRRPRRLLLRRVQRSVRRRYPGASHLRPGLSRRSMCGAAGRVHAGRRARPCVPRVLSCLRHLRHGRAHL